MFNTVILIEVLFHVLMPKRGKSLNYFKYDTFVGHFPNDTLASMAVKGLNNEAKHAVRLENGKEGCLFFCIQVTVEFTPGR